MMGDLLLEKALGLLGRLVKPKRIRASGVLKRAYHFQRVGLVVS